MPNAVVVEIVNDRFGGAVPSIVLNDYLEVAIGLIDEGCERVSKGVRPLKRRNNQRETRHLST
jgi:hypothetical protein